MAFRSEGRHYFNFYFFVRQLPARFRVVTLLFSLLLSLWARIVEAAANYQFYVSEAGSDTNPGTLLQPFRSITRAQQAARTAADEIRHRPAGSLGSVDVYIRAGLYQFDSTLQFNESDGLGGDNYVTYQAYSKADPVTGKAVFEPVRISGGRIVSGFQAHATVNGKTIYKATYQGNDVRQLYVNARRAGRATSPTYSVSSWDTASQSFIISSPDAPKLLNWLKYPNAEISIQSAWTLFRFKNNTGSLINSTTIRLSPNAYYSKLFFSLYSNYINNFSSWRNGQVVQFENAMAFLDAEGKFVTTVSADGLTTNVFYIPRAGEDIRTALVTAPRIKTLVKVQGQSFASVKNIRFKNLIFEETNWAFTFKPSLRGYMGAQGGINLLNLPLRDPGDDRGFATIPAAFVIEGASNVSVMNSIFRNLGGSGLSISSGSLVNRILGNSFEDIAGIGIVVDEVTPTVRDKEKYQRLGPCVSDIIQDNRITRIGLDYFDSAGILAGATNGLIISRNAIYDVPYTAISVGLMMDFNTPLALQTPLQKNIIERNNIYNFMKKLNDGGAIYTRNPQVGSHIKENWIHNMQLSPYALRMPMGHGVYLDERSAAIAVHDNVIETDSPVFTNVPGNGNTFTNNDSTSITIKNSAGPKYLFNR